MKRDRAKNKPGKPTVREVAAMLGKAKSQVHRDILSGKLDLKDLGSTAELQKMKLAVEVEERKRRVQLHQLKIDEQRRQLIPAADVAGIITKLLAIVTSSVDFALLSRLPQMNAGLDAARQRANNEPECNEIRRRILDEAEAYLKRLHA